MSIESKDKHFWSTITEMYDRYTMPKASANTGAITNTGAIGATSTPVMTQSTRFGTNYSQANQPLWVSSNGPYYSASTDTYHYGAPTPNMEEIGSRLDAIEKRLLIIHPEKYLLDKYPDLAVAYEQYKSLEDQYRTYDILKENKENG